MDICLITKEPINNKITLPCKHSFDYYYLYLEIIEQKKTKKNFNCPYCRYIYNFTLPFYEIDNVEKIHNINYNQTKTLPIFNCEKCNKPGHKFKNGVYCIKDNKDTHLEFCQATCKNGNKCKNKTYKLFCTIHKKYI